LVNGFDVCVFHNNIHMG